MSKRKPTPDEEPKKETTSDEESGDETNPGDEPKKETISNEESGDETTPDDETKKEKISDEESRDETNPGGGPNDHPGDSPKGEKSPGEAKKMPDPKISARQPGNSVVKTVIGAAVGAGLAVAVPPLFISMLGFTGAGIVAGSFAAKMMSAAAIANGGGVAAGSTVAVLQSLGAAGLSVGTNIGLGTVGAAGGAWLSKLKKTSK